MATVDCPHCGQANEGGGQFCAGCGKALPSATPSGPRVVTGDAVASTEVGKTVQADQLRKQAGQAFGALIAVAVLSLIGGIVFYALLKGGPPEAARAAPVVLAMNIVLAALFTGLAVWARFNPLPAAIVGLLLFLTIHLVNGILEPASILQGILVKVIIIVVLAKAIQAGVKYRQLRERMTT